MKYTKGPWLVGVTQLNGEQIIGTKDGQLVCVATTGIGLNNNTTTTIANAHLIAAAPDLLEALELIASTDPVDAALDPQRAMRVAKAAIKKALGE